MNIKGTLFCVVTMAMLSGFAEGEDSYTAQIQKWREQREAALRADDSWLTVTGLFWLKEGANHIGSDPSNDVLLPDQSAPAQVGVLTLSGASASFEAASESKVTLNGKPVATEQIRSNSSDVLAVNRIKLLLLKRGERYALRLKDNEAAQRRNFAGLSWYPVRPEWRLEARFEALEAPARLILDNIIGDQEEVESPGYVVFEKEGKEYKLQASGSGKGLFIVFRDQTSGKETYGSSRFLYTAMPENGKVILDFNEAINPPCAFTAYATCPIAPPQNRLPIAIPVGELKYKGHDTVSSRE
jgi:uncharacterized protein (DUF1684 family)